MKTLSCHHFEPPAYIIVRRRSTMKNFHSLKISQMKKFTVSAFKRNRFHKNFVPRGTFYLKAISENFSFVKFLTNENFSSPTASLLYFMRLAQKDDMKVFSFFVKFFTLLHFVFIYRATGSRNWEMKTLPNVSSCMSVILM